MRSISSSLTAAALVGTTMVHQVAGVPMLANPGGKTDIIITAENTVNGTAQPVHNSTVSSNTFSIQSTQSLPLKFVNNYPNGNLNAYVTGKDSNNQVVLLQPDGTFYYPNANGATTPQSINANVAIPMSGQGSTTSINIPDYISSARIWFAAGDLQFFVVTDGNGGTSLVEPSSNNPSDPSASINWGFVELTNTQNGGLFANLSYVDFVGLVLGMLISKSDGSTQEAKGLSSSAVSSICNDLKAQSSSDGQPWGDMCVTDSSGNALRIAAPIDYISTHGGAFDSYWGSYIDQVWDKYSSQTLTVDTQNGYGQVACHVSSNQLICDGDNRAYDKPSATDIFGCNGGPFGIQSGDNDIHKAIVPRLCAAFNRGTLLLDGGDLQPNLGSGSYYTTSPTNHYSRIVHNYEVDGHGYAFSYDDVKPNGAPDQSGTLTDGSPQYLQITVGGPQ